MMRILLTLVIALACAPAYAQQAAKKPPLEVSAKQSLEWRRDSRVFIARVDAIAKQGTSELHGDTLTASYTDGPKGKGMDINRINAEGHVVVISGGSKATGDKGYYDVKAGYSELTGNNLMLQTPTDTVTAKDKITYDANKREMNAYGNAKAVRGDDTITSNRLIGRFIADPQGGTKLQDLEAIGNVVVISPSETMYGEHGIYDAATNKAVITGNVRIERGPNTINGSRGEIDMNTNISRMFGGTDPAAPSVDGKAPDGRVRGVFYPE